MTELQIHVVYSVRFGTSHRSGMSRPTRVADPLYMVNVASNNHAMDQQLVSAGLLSYIHL